MESFIIFGILLIALFLVSWIKMEKAAEAEEGYFDDTIKNNSAKKE